MSIYCAFIFLHAQYFIYLDCRVRVLHVCRVCARVQTWYFGLNLVTWHLLRCLAETFRLL